MASPITFSGFNEIDFNLILNAVMQQASQPLTALETRQSGVESQITTYGTFTAKALELGDAAAALADADSVATLTATSSHTDIATASVGADAAAGRFDVIVTALARAQVTVSASSAPDSDTTVVASGGTLTIGGIDVAIAGDVTLKGLAGAINDTEGIGVTAAVLRTGTDTYRLVLTSRETGVDNAFTVVNGLTGGAGVAFTDTDADNVTGDSPADNAVSASDASLLINNVAVTGSTNTFADIITGVTLTVTKADPAETVTIDVAPDGEALKDKVEAFLSAYNGFVEFQTGQRTSAAEGSTTSIGNGPLLRGLRSSLRSELLAAHGSGFYTRLSEVGIEFTSTGQLELDEARFAEALADNGDAVRDLFASSESAFAQVEAQVAEYTQTNGFISNVTDGLRRQVETMEDQIIAMQARLALQRESLLREFIEADLAMSRLKNQASSLAQFGSGLGSV